MTATCFADALAYDALGQTASRNLSEPGVVRRVPIGLWWKHQARPLSWPDTHITMPMAGRTLAAIRSSQCRKGPMATKRGLLDPRSQLPRYDAA